MIVCLEHTKICLEWIEYFMLGIIMLKAKCL